MVAGVVLILILLLDVMEVAVAVAVADAVVVMAVPVFSSAEWAAAAAAAAFIMDVTVVVDLGVQPGARELESLPTLFHPQEAGLDWMESAGPLHKNLTCLRKDRRSLKGPNFSSLPEDEGGLEVESLLESRNPAFIFCGWFLYEWLLFVVR